MQNAETKGDVLIVDDQFDNLRLLSNLLIEYGYSVRVAKTGKEALVAIQSLLPDLVLLDVRLSDIDGFEVCAQIKSNPIIADIPIIFLSSLNDSEEILKAFEVGGVDYISKPYKSAEVISRVKTHVELNKIRLNFKLKSSTIEVQNDVLNQLNEELNQTNELLFELQKTTQEARERFELLFKLNPYAVTITQISNGIIIDANEGFCKLFGYTPEEVIGKSTLEVNIWPTSQDRLRFVAAITEKGLLSDFECMLCRKNGTLFSALVSTSIIDNNGISHILCVTRDITEQKRAEKELRESEAKYRLLFKSMNSAFLLSEMIVDENNTPIDFRILDGNPKLKEFFGYSINEVKGKTIKEIFPNANSSMIAKFGAVALTGKAISIEYFSDTFNKHLSVNTYSPQKGQFVSIYEDITERKQVEAQLKERNQFIESLINISPEILYIYDVLEGKNIFSNDRIQSILGFSTEEVREMENQLIPTLMHPDDLINYVNNILPLYTTAKDNDQILHSYRMKSKTGEWHWIESTEIIYKRLADGSPQQIFGIGHDITERKNIEEALEKNEIRYSSLFNEMLEGFALHEIICNQAGEPVDYKFLSLNPAFEKLTGLQAKTIIGKTVKEIMPQIEPFWIESYGKVALTGEPFSFESYTKELDSYFQINAFSHQKGQFAVLFENITDRKRSEVAQAELAKRLSLLNQLVYSSLDSASVGAWWIDFSENDIFHALDTTIKILGISLNKSNQDAYLLSDWVKLLQETSMSNPEYANDIDNTLEQFSGTISGKYESYRADYPVLLPQGTIRWIEARANVSERDLGGKARYMTGTLIDITERKQAEVKIEQQNNELIDLNNTKDKFFSIIAHDLRGPLGNLCQFTQLIIDNFDIYEKDKILNFTILCNNLANKTFYLLGNLLEWSLLQRGQLIAKPVKCDVGDLVVDAITFFEEKAKSKNVRLQNNTFGKLSVLCDDNMTKTILRNLLSNAIKFGKGGGCVTISAHERGAFIEIQIQDTGEGIALETIPNLFNIARNKSTLGTDSEKGTGLGLPLCKELAEKQGGQLWVVSELGKGSTFSFTIKKNDEK